MSDAPPINPPFEPLQPPEIPGVDIVAHGFGWVAIDKPSGLLSVPGLRIKDSVLLRVRRVFPAAEASHRLDMDTSGVMVVGTKPQTHRALSAAFRERRTRKRYAAVTWGAPTPSEGTIDLPIGGVREERPRRKVDHETGKPSITHYRVLDAASADAVEPTAFVDLAPHTGRTHQLRVHLAAVGCPILGDNLYAPQNALEARDRLMLHAHSLVFPDPTHGRDVTVTAPLPFDGYALPDAWPGPSVE